MRRYERTGNEVFIHGRWPPPPFPRLYLKHPPRGRASGGMKPLADGLSIRQKIPTNWPIDTFTHRHARSPALAFQNHLQVSVTMIAKLASCANSTACMRVCTPSLRIMAVTCAFTVVSAMESS
jgi:hypothetical protein